MRYDPKLDNYIRCESPEELVAYLETMPRKFVNYIPHFSGEPFDKAINLLRNGDLANMNAAQKIIDQVNDANIMTTGVKLLAPSVVGFVPVVPAVISGIPYNMLTRDVSEIEATNTPLTIYVDTVVSAGLSHQELTNRGIAILAFTLAMSNIRPVDLYTIGMVDIYSRGRCSGHITRIETRPLDLARAAFMLTSPTFARCIMHSVARATSKIDGHIGCAPWPWSLMPDTQEYTNEMRVMLNMQPQDIFFPGGWLFDKLMLRDPVKWVKQMIEKHNTQSEQQL